MNHAVAFNGAVHRTADASRIPLLFALNNTHLCSAEKMAFATALGLRDKFTPVILAPGGEALDEARRLGFPAHEFDGTKSFIKVIFPYLVNQPALVFLTTDLGQSLALSALNLIYRRKNIHAHIVDGASTEQLGFGRKKVLNWFGVEIVATSDYVRERLIANGVKWNKITVIEGFMDEQDSRRVPQRKSFTERGIKNVIVNSPGNPNNRVDLLLDSLDREPRLSKLNVCIYGTGEGFATLRARAKRNNPNVRFAGFPPDMKKCLPKADLLLHPCREESAAPTIFESFAARVPVLVPDAGTTGSLVADGVSGFRFRANNADALAMRLNGLLNMEPEELNAVVEGGLDSLSLRFSASRGIEEYRRLLHRLN